ncbi:hypothetical protein BBJ28_00027136, partial [Nothophytophthora sp. Chile5]
MYDMLMLLEETVASTDRTPRGCKLFSILPVTTSFVPSYITINTTVLYDMGKRIMKQKGIDVFNLFKRTDTKGAKVYATTGEFQAMRHRIWPEFLRVDRHTSKKKDPELGILRRNFEYQVQTNGYGAAVLTSIPAKVSRNPSVEYKLHTKTNSIGELFNIDNKLPGINGEQQRGNCNEQRDTNTKLPDSNNELQPDNNVEHRPTIS